MEEIFSTKVLLELNQTCSKQNSRPPYIDELYKFQLEIEFLL